MANYILRKFDDAIWIPFRARCAAEGHSIRWVLTELIKHYVSVGDHAIPAYKAQPPADGGDGGDRTTT